MQSSDETDRCGTEIVGVRRRQTREAHKITFTFVNLLLTVE